MFPRCNIRFIFPLCYINFSVLCFHLDGSGGPLYLGIHPVHLAGADGWHRHDSLHQLLWGGGEWGACGEVGRSKWYGLQFSKSNIGLSFTELISDQGNFSIFFPLQGILALNIIDHATMVFFTAGNIRMQLESRQTQSASHHPPNWIFALKDYSNCDWDK